MPSPGASPLPPPTGGAVPGMSTAQVHVALQDVTAADRPSLSEMIQKQSFNQLFA
jgi:uncharacterized lipoprotein YbaY